MHVFPDGLQALKGPASVVAVEADKIPLHLQARITQYIQHVSTNEDFKPNAVINKTLDAATRENTFSPT